MFAGAGSWQVRSESNHSWAHDFRDPVRGASRREDHLIYAHMLALRPEPNYLWSALSSSCLFLRFFLGFVLCLF